MSDLKKNWGASARESEKSEKDSRKTSSKIEKSKRSDRTKPTAGSGSVKSRNDGGKSGRVGGNRDADAGGKKDRTRMQKRLNRLSFIMGGLVVVVLLVGLLIYYLQSSTKKVSGITAEEVLALAASNISSIDESTQEWEFSYDMEGSYGGSTYLNTLSLGVDFMEQQSEGVAYMEVTQKMVNQTDDEDAETASSSAVSYIEEQSDGWYNYSSTDDGAWYYAVVEEETADILLREKNFLTTLHGLDVTWTLAERTKRVEKQHAYVLTAEIPAEEAMELLNFFDMALVSEDATGYLTGKTVEITYAIYEESGLPAEISISFTELYQQIWDEMLTEETATDTDADSDSGTDEDSDDSEDDTDTAEDDSELTVNKYDATIIFTGYEVEEDIVVPDEAKDTATLEEAAGWTEPEAKEWYDYFIENRGTDLEGLYGITEDNYESVSEEEWESIYYHEIGY
ncbi:MAG: hypothetical protein LUE29_12555 [Lachnospiraceae bacterium]|nr:hypothetical protein [Lachnospiraceae bacterium]